MKKILFVGSKYRYDDHSGARGRLSHDYSVWYESLLRFCPDRLTASAYWFDEVLVSRGRRAMNEDLLAHITRTKPNLVIFAFGDDEINIATLDLVTRDFGIKTVYLAGDDTWRFDSTSRYFGPHCTWAFTSYSRTIPKYRALGCRDAILYAGWANTDHFYKEDVPKDIDVGFVGMWTTARANLVAALRRSGVSVTARGKGWPEGELDQDVLADFISRTKIMLGLLGSGYYFGWRPLVRLFLRRPRLGSRIRMFIPDIHHLIRNYREWRQKKIPQTKGRLFEVPACGTMQLAEHAEDLELYYEPGKEIVLFTDTDDCVHKVQYYLKHSDEREAIAQAGYARTLRDHIAPQRLTKLFSQIGLLS